MPHAIAVINVVGLTDALIGPWSPHLADLKSQSHLRQLTPSLPAVTTTVQSSMLTGLTPQQHGIVSNGWYNRELAEIQFWKQSNHLVQGEKVWETARRRDPSITCANMFWWYNMYSTADFSVTPRPIYKADGRKIPDCYSHPANLRDLLQAQLGQFPLFNFWGPAASIKSSQWIAQASKIVHQRHDPTLMLIYLPHLDYDLQRFGPPPVSRPTTNTPQHPALRAVAEIDAVIGDLLAYFNNRNVRVILLSEYGIEPVDTPIAINRLLRDHGSLAVREEQGLELLDAGASDAFAVADHQVAHIYLRNETDIDHYARLLSDIHGIDLLLTRRDQPEYNIAHPRSGDIVLVAKPGCWFTYDYWLNDSRAPDFARTVDIHRKPGYDPRELFLNPNLTAPKARITAKLLLKNLGFRTLMNLIPLDANLVRGSHGRLPDNPQHKPILLTQRRPPSDNADLPCHVVRDVILDHLFSD